MTQDFHHSQNRRCRDHDYRSRCIYMITMMKSHQAPIFSTITADPRVKKISPIIRFSPAGRIICRCLSELCVDYPELRILCWRIMPDHIHFELFVTRPTDLPLGSMMASFKASCTTAYRDKYPQSQLAADGLSLFEDGFNDKIVFRQGAKDAFYEYIMDNPRRYLVKKLYPEYFFHKLQLQVGHMKCGLYGNIFLLDHPVKSFIKISRIKERTPDLEAKEKEWDETLRCGGVFVSPFINPYEKEYRDAAIENGNGIILITDYRFSDRKKPYKELFDLCAEGRLLIVSTEEFATPPKAMTYAHACELNHIAEQIASLPPKGARLIPRKSHSGGES